MRNNRSIGRCEILPQEKGVLPQICKCLHAETRSLSFELSAPARLIVTSTPAEAQVLVDGKAVGVTPLTVDKLKPGEHGIDISRAGFRSVSKTISLASGATDSLAVVLDPPPALPPEQAGAATSQPVTAATPAAAPAVVEKASAPAAATKKESDAKSRGILDKVAIGVFALFSLVILGVELAQNK